MLINDCNPRMDHSWFYIHESLTQTHDFFVGEILLELGAHAPNQN